MKKAEIVIGANCGDEGKGTVVARLAKDGGKTLNILTNGGSQRGHTVVTEIGTHKFQHFGSGTYHGAASYYSPFFIINPMQFVKEWNELIVKPVVYRNSKCLWTTPFDMMANAISEEMRGTHASCRMGIWNTIRRSRVFRMNFDQFVKMKEPIKRTILNQIKNFYENDVSGMSSEWRKLWDSEGIVNHYLEDCDFVYKNTIRVITDDNSFSRDFDTFIFENGQGLLIGDTGVDSVENTPSQTGLYIPSLVKGQLGLDNTNCETTIHYVTRPYMTRHGDGRIYGENRMENISSGIREDESNPYNEGQGEFRYGKLSITALKERIDSDANGNPYVVELTHCDEMDRVKSFRRKFENVVTTSDPLV